jgi:hypothetical protein
LNDDHLAHVVDLIDKKPDIVLEEIMDSLTSGFDGLKISTILGAVSAKGVVNVKV